MSEKLQFGWRRKVEVGRPLLYPTLERRRSVVLPVQCPGCLRQSLVGYAFDTQAQSENAIMSVNNSLAAYKGIDVSKLTLRVDNGSQYTSKKFIESMKALGVRVEHIFRNTPEQNGHMESFHGKLKREYIWTSEFRNYQEAEIAISRAFVDYNEKRPHSSLGYRTPNEFLSEWRLTHS
jgi:putative transposase